MQNYIDCTNLNICSPSVAWMSMIIYVKVETDKIKKKNRLFLIINCEIFKEKL